MTFLRLPAVQNDVEHTEHTQERQIDRGTKMADKKHLSTVVPPFIVARNYCR